MAAKKRVDQLVADSDASLDGICRAIAIIHEMAKAAGDIRTAFAAQMAIEGLAQYRAASAGFIRTHCKAAD